MRDDFDKQTKEALAKRVGLKCSNPNCRQPTSGPQTDENEALNIGVAAHITAASPGGARYDPNLSPEERSSIQNGIWLCQNCAKLIDNDEDRYTTSLLRSWKDISENETLKEVEKNSKSKSDINEGTPKNLSKIEKSNIKVDLKYQAFEASYDLFSLFSPDTEHKDQKIKVIQARIKKLGVQAQITEDLYSGDEASGERMSQFYINVGTHIRVNLSEKIASYFALPINTFVTVKDQSESSNRFISFDSIRDALEGTDLPPSFQTELDRIENQHEDRVESGEDFPYSRIEETPLVKWLNRIRSYITEKHDSANPLQ